jgi:hypothetical protein
MREFFIHSRFGQLYLVAFPSSYRFFRVATANAASFTDADLP